MRIGSLSMSCRAFILVCVAAALSFVAGYISSWDKDRLLRAPGSSAESWLSQDCLQLLRPSQRTFAHFIPLLESTGTGGNLTTDALIAALAIEHGGTVHTTDRDFDRFPGVRWENPLET